jgi:O-antigen ligase
VTAPSFPTVCRTIVVLAFLVVLAVAGRPAWLSTVLGLALVAVWAAPLVLRRHHVVPVPAEAPAEAV